MGLMKDWLVRFVPVFRWLPAYQRSSLQGDLTAGIVVLFITVPQVIAYAFLAGLPPESGLYAALAALCLYGLFGSSRTLAVGPSAIVAMMTLEVASDFARPGTDAYTLVCLQLALVTGVVLLLLRLVNFGNVTSFLSHAVVTGFISAAAVLIISNQLPAILGLSSATDTRIFGVISHLFDGGQYNLVAIIVALLALGLLAFCRFRLEPLLRRMGTAEWLAAALSRSAPMFAVAIAVIATALADLGRHFALPLVGDIPTALPSFGLGPVSFTVVQDLLPSALLIAMVIFMESTSIGTAMAAKRREKIDPDQELVGLGAANVGASLFGGFPVAGSFARSIVNLSAGASTQLASWVTAGLVLITLVAFAPLFYYLPKAVLSAIIVISAMQLIDPAAIRKIFSFNTADAVVFAFTFVLVMVLGVEAGVLIGILISFILLIRSSSRPHIAVVGRVGDTEHFRNVRRHQVRTSPKLLAIRIDESLYFVNTRYIESFLFREIARKPELRHVLLICSATNFIDTSGLEMLEGMMDSLAEAGVTLHLAEVKGPVMDRLEQTAFYRAMKGKVFFTTDDAFLELAEI
ncbi:MAG: sulfate permease [Proteobacteria bacterium]|nr:sulfate permease [Pseudomonadota bacterium]